ncbi:MAG: hypothetical protein JWO06_4113 [Bacteroidota bacterium]|nr:hypothetical protein [Bacteroidota bacterium]
MFWLMICFANIFFGQIVCSPLGIRAEHESFYQTFAIVGTWMFISPSVMTFFATMAGVISIVFGVYIYRELLRFSIPGKAVKTGKDGLAFIFQLYAIPIIIGSVPLVLLCNHFSLYTFAFIFANLMLIGFGMAIMNGGRKFWVKSSKTKALWRTPVIEMTLAVVAWACIYLFFRG